MPGSSHQRERAGDVARTAPALPPPSTACGRSLSRGIMMLPNYKGPIVEIRPSKWTDNKIWIQADNYPDAQYIVDAVFYYIGKGPFYFPDANFQYPPLRLEHPAQELLTREACSKHVKSIAKGAALKKQRADYRKRVKKLVFKAVKSADAVLFLGRLETSPEARYSSELNRSSRMQEAERRTAPALPGASRPRKKAASRPRKKAASLPREEDASLPKEDAPASPPVDDNDDGAGRETPMEEDHVSLVMVRGFVSSQPTVAGFELNPERFNAGVSGKSLHSVEESLGSKYLVDDCPNGHDEDGTRITKLMRDGTPAIAVPSAKTPRSISANQTYIPTDILIDTSHVAQRRGEICFIDHSYIDSVAAP